MMKKNVTQPQITVIIPTRERPDTLDKSLKTLISQDYDNLQIIVSDNFSCDNTEDVVHSYNDVRIKYLNTGKRLSMSHNWEFALTNVADGWVTILGDDDGLLPASLNKVSEIIQSTDIQAIRSKTCVYAWPSLLGKEYGLLEIPLRTGYEVRDSKTWLLKVMNGQVHYNELPMLYNGGFIAIGVLKAIKRKTGAFYQSCSPDVYSAISISSVADQYIYSHEPFAINGSSGYSTGASIMALDAKSGQSPAQKFHSEGNINFHKVFPLCADGNFPPSIQAFVYESYLQSAMLRDEAPNSMHKQQLELILATAGRHHVSIGEWGKVFAATHGFDYQDIKYRAHRRTILSKLASLPSRISLRFNTYSAEPPEFFIKDVYEASIIAGEIRNAMPSRLKQIHRFVGRVGEKLFG